MSVLNSRGAPIGKAGPASSKLTGLYRITARRGPSGQGSSTVQYSIISGDPTPAILELSTDAEYDLIMDYSNIWKAGFASFANPSTRLQYRLNGGSLITLAEDDYTGGSNSCASIVACSIEGKTNIISVNSGARRFGLSLRNFAGIGYALCESDFNISVLMQLKAGTVENIRNSFSPWSSVNVEQLS